MGKITIVSTSPGATGSTTLVALTEDNKAKAVKTGQEVVQERIHVTRDPAGIINRMTLKYNALLDGTFLNTITINATASQADYSQVMGASIDGYGIYENPFLQIGGAVAVWQRQMAATALAYFSRPIAVASRSFDFSLVTRLFPGTQVTITDNSMINPQTGTRGVSGLLGWVQSTIFDWSTGVGSVKVVFSPQRSDRFTLWAPSAQVDSTYNSSGFVNGYKAATKQVKFVDHAYSLATEGLDVSNFAAGDKVHIVDASPSNATSPLGATDILASVDSSGGFAVLTTGFGAFDSTKRYVLEYDVIANATSSQKATHAFIAASTSKSTGLAANDAYLWGGDVATWPDTSFTFTTKYKKADFTRDDQGTAFSVHKFGDISEFANTALVYHTAPVLVNENLFPYPTTNNASYITVYGPVFVPLYYGGQRRLDVRVLTDAGATSGTWRVVTSALLPVSSGSEFIAPEYFDVTATSQNWISFDNPGGIAYLSGLINQPATANGFGGAVGTWLTVDVARTGDKGEMATMIVRVAEWPESL